MSVEEMMKFLPVNRDERFYTATVLPTLIGREGFRFFSCFTDLIRGFPAVDVRASGGDANIAFFPEYSVTKSITRQQESGLLTPDLVVFINDQPSVLLVVEGKMFERPTPAALKEQMELQGAAVKRIQERCHPGVTYHCALLSNHRATEFAGFDFPIVWWEDVRDAFAARVPEDYFLSVLSYALRHWQALVGQNTSHQYCEGHLQLQEIFDLWQGGVCEYEMMGRSGANYYVRNGGEVSYTVGQFERDIDNLVSGGWPLKNGGYCLRKDSTPRRNWFPVAQGMQRVASHLPK